MSAFIVSEEHIRYLVNAGLSRRIVRGYGLAWKAEEGPHRSLQGGDDSDDTTGTMLWAANFESVGYRYREERTAPAYTHRPDYKTPEPVQVLKAIACYEYQSCEHPGWLASEARAFCEALRHAAIGALPGYDTASWAITE